MSDYKYYTTLLVEDDEQTRVCWWSDGFHSGDIICDEIPEGEEIIDWHWEW